MRAMVGSHDRFNGSDGDAPGKGSGAVQFSNSRSGGRRDAACLMQLNTNDLMLMFRPRRRWIARVPAAIAPKVGLPARPRWPNQRGVCLELSVPAPNVG